MKTIIPRIWKTKVNTMVANSKGVKIKYSCGTKSANTPAVSACRVTEGRNWKIL
jgi:hypothetical protein